MDNLQENKKTFVVEEIEDDAFLRQILSDRFTKDGFNVLEAKDGEEGLSVAMQNHPDLILLDILMPKMDGLTMLKRLRADSWGKTVPVIILTNVDDMGRVSDALGSEVFEYYIKSDTSIENLVTDVKKNLAEGRHRLNS